MAASGLTITVALAIDHTPSRLKLKFLDCTNGGQARKGNYDPRHTPKIGTVYLTNRPGISQMNGMLISDAYRGRGLAKVMIALWCKLCVTSGVAMRTGIIDKPILVHVLESLGFSGVGGMPVFVTGATRLIDCQKVTRGRSGVVRVNRELVPAEEAVMQRAVQACLEGGSLELLTSVESLEAALQDAWRVDGRVII